MRRFRSLLIDQPDVRLPGLRIQTFAVHRHLPEHASVEPHHHRWSQVLLYLSGRGRESVAGREVPITPGTLVALPPGTEHAFRRAGGHAPLCLMIDFRVRGTARLAPQVCSVPRSECVEIRQHLSHLRGDLGEGGPASHWEDSVAIFQILLILLRAVGWIERRPLRRDLRPTRATHALLEGVNLVGPLAAIVCRSGYQRDHLNRLVKAATGLTLGEYRAAKRLERAKELLGQGFKVASVAAAVGLADPNYFARWFRRQTGRRPSRWEKEGSGNRLRN